MRIKKSFGDSLVTIAIIIVAIIAVGYIGSWFAQSNDCVSCKLGVGGECGTLGSCDEECDMEEVTLCWMPVCQEKIIEEEK